MTIRSVPGLQSVVVRDGVTLRPLKREDTEALLAILGADPIIREHVGVASRLHAPADIETLLVEEKDDRDIIRYVILERGVVVGMVNFWRAGDYFGDKADPNDYGFGYFLAPSARGRGLVTDSLRALMNIAEKTLGATSFIAFCETDNTASEAALRKAGFEKTELTWHYEEHGWVEQKYTRRTA